MSAHELLNLLNELRKRDKLQSNRIEARMSASTRENLSSVFASNLGAVQPAHPRCLISAFIIRLFESIISRLATGEISIF